MPFAKLGLSDPLLEGVKAMGYIDPTPIQLRAIPLILAGQDVIGAGARFAQIRSALATASPGATISVASLSPGRFRS